MAITKVARMASLQNIGSSLLPTGPAGWLIFFTTQGASEFLMFSQAKGDANEWWHCVNERIMIWTPHGCNMIDENGNRLPVEDRGPFMNFVHNFYGPILWEDIDGDGKLESPFTKFVATMQDLGDAVYNFFDSSEDGKGFVENTVEMYINGVKTMVNVAKGGWEWTEKKVKQASDWTEEKVDKIGEAVGKAGSKVKVWANKALKGIKGVLGHGDDDD